MGQVMRLQWEPLRVWPISPGLLVLPFGTICCLQPKDSLSSSELFFSNLLISTQVNISKTFKHLLIHPSYTFMKLKHAKTVVVLCLCSHCIFYAKCPYSESCLQMLISETMVLTFCRGKRETRSSHLLKNSSWLLCVENMESFWDLGSTVSCQWQAWGLVENACTWGSGRRAQQSVWQSAVVSDGSCLSWASTRSWNWKTVRSGWLRAIEVHLSPEKMGIPDLTEVFHVGRMLRFRPLPSWVSESSFCQWKTIICKMWSGLKTIHTTSAHTLLSEPQSHGHTRQQDRLRVSASSLSRKKKRQIRWSAGNFCHRQKCRHY